MSACVGRESDKFSLRFPDGLRDRIKSAAAQNFRSMNAEIVIALERAFPASGPKRERGGQPASFPRSRPKENAARQGDARATPEDGFPK